MGPENISPEERLFKIIRDGKTAPPEDKRKTAVAAQSGGMRAGSTPTIKQFFAGLNPLKRLFPRGAPAGSGGIHETLHAGQWGTSQLAKGAALPFGIDLERLKTINKLLVAFLIIITGFAFYYLLNARPSVSGIINGVPPAPLERKNRPPIEVFKPLAFYMEAPKKRDILRPTPLNKEEIALPEEKPPQKALTELAGQLTLQGISWGQAPKAIIKDGADGQVYFVKIGQIIGGTEIKVIDIKKDKVTIGYNDEEMELR